MSVCCVPKIQYMNENLFLKAVGIRYANVSGLGDVFYYVGSWSDFQVQ